MPTWTVEKNAWITNDQQLTKILGDGYAFLQHTVDFDGDPKFVADINEALEILKESYPDGDGGYILTNDVVIDTLFAYAFPYMLIDTLDTNDVINLEREERTDNEGIPVVDYGLDRSTLPPEESTPFPH